MVRRDEDVVLQDRYDHTLPPVQQPERTSGREIDLNFELESIHFATLPIAFLVGTAALCSVFGLLIFVVLVKLNTVYHHVSHEDDHNKEEEDFDEIMETGNNSSNLGSSNPVALAPLSASPSPPNSANATSFSFNFHVPVLPINLQEPTETSEAIPTATEPNEYMLYVLHNDYVQPPSVSDLPQVQKIRNPSENKENTAPNSPNLVASATYKQGNYFRFPEVDAWPPQHANSNPDSSLPTTAMGAILSPPEVPDVPRNSPTMRRARLKSISLDSETARVVEDNLNVGVQDLCLMTPAETASNPRNKHQLKIDLRSTEESETESRQHPPTPKTPTLTQSRQKAISLDSDKPTAPVPMTNNGVSASVPTTPKRHHLMLSLQGSASTGSQHHHYHQQQQQHHHHHSQSSHHYHHSYHHSHHNHHQYHHHRKTRSITSDHLGSNLHLKTVTLSVSNNNLKTLPEAVPLSPTTTTDATPISAAAVTSAIAPLSLASATPSTFKQQRSGASLLQRRGSNHSLTLNLAGSVGDLSGATSLAGSTTQIVPKRHSLLQRRGSNASLTIQGSDLSLSRFNSHGSLNEARAARAKNHLSVSNYSLRSSAHNLLGRPLRPSCSSSGSGADPRSASHHHPKFFSSENLNQNNMLKYCQTIDIDGPVTTYFDGCEPGEEELLDSELLDELHYCQAGAGGADGLDDDGDGIRRITTKPLSPQSTSEDFKIYLANIQYLQNASNVLHQEDIRQMDVMFRDLRDYQRLPTPAKLSAEQEQLLNVQRRKLREIHQEFWDLPTNHQEKPMVFGSQPKNRYKTILPNEHSRVILEPEEMSSTPGTPPLEPYINANYIKVSRIFILCLKTIKVTTP